MKIVFMGTPDYATKIFKLLKKQSDFDLSLVVTQMDKPVGRKMKLTPPHIKNYIIQNKIDVKIYQPKNLKDEDSYSVIKSHNPNYIVVAAYGHILPKSILDIAPCINLHASILPLYRGSSPIQASILNNDNFTGVTAMKMDVGLDTGDMLGFRYIKMDKHIKVDKLFDDLSDAAALLCVEVLKRFSNINPIAQKDCESSIVKKISKNDGLIDLKNSFEDYLKFRAYCGWPGVFLENGLKIKHLKPLDDENSHERGKIIEIRSDSIVVGCSKGLLEIQTVQQPSKKEIDAVSYVRGKRLNIGDKIL